MCPGRATTDESDQLLSTNNNHNHEANEVEVGVAKVLCAMKERAKAETTSIPRIYQEGMQSVSQDADIAATLPTYCSIRTSLYSKRRERLPPLPSTIDEVDFSGEWSKTFNGEDFLRAARNNVFMFATESNLKVLSEAMTVYCDGTFSVCPRLFYQLFTIHCIKHGKQFPLVYFLLPSKSRETYNMAFLLFKEICQNYSIDLDPQQVKTDFELALVQSLAISFPNAEFRGCFYHLSQAIWNKQQLGGLA